MWSILACLACWSNFRVDDLQGTPLTLEAFLSGESGDREVRFVGGRFDRAGRIVRLSGDGEFTGCDGAYLPARE